MTVDSRFAVMLLTNKNGNEVKKLQTDITTDTVDHNNTTAAVAGRGKVVSVKELIRDERCYSVGCVGTFDVCRSEVCRAM